MDERLITNVDSMEIDGTSIAKSSTSDKQVRNLITTLRMFITNAYRRRLSPTIRSKLFLKAHGKKNSTPSFGGCVHHWGLVSQFTV